MQRDRWRSHARISERIARSFRHGAELIGSRPFFSFNHLIPAFQKMLEAYGLWPLGRNPPGA